MKPPTILIVAISTVIAARIPTRLFGDPSCSSIDDDDAGNSICDRHQWRVQGMADIPDNLKANKTGQRKYDKMLHEAGRGISTD